MHLHKGQFKEYVYKSSPSYVLRHNKTLKSYSSAFISNVNSLSQKKKKSRRKPKVLSPCPAVTSSRPQMKTNILPAAQTGTSAVCMQEGQPHCVKCTYMSIYYGQTLWSRALGAMLESKTTSGGEKPSSSTQT